MSKEATAIIMKVVMDRFKKGIPIGSGVVVALNEGDYPTIIGDIEKIDAKVDGMLILYSRYVAARMIFGRVYVAYRKNESPNIVIDKSFKEELFKEQCNEVGEIFYHVSSFVGQSPYDIDDERGLNFIGGR